MSNNLDKFYTSMSNNLDKFYTNPDIVDLCLQELSEHCILDMFTAIIEPSAGCGNFLDKLPKRNTIALDIEPDRNDIVKQDFLTYNLPEYYDHDDVGGVLVIGNPPFGKNSSLAVKFFNHAAEINGVNVIAFIVPRTFRKISIQNRLNLNFKILSDFDIPMNPCSFTPKMNAKCCFQIYGRIIEGQQQRSITKLPTTHPDFEFLSYNKDDAGQPTPPSGADFAIRAYGGKCGEIIMGNLMELRPKSYHFIKSNIGLSLLVDTFNSLDYSLSENTARQNSLGRAELICLYTEFRNSEL